MKITGIVRHGHFKKQFKKLSKGIQESFEERIYVFLKDQNNIVLNNHPLLGDREGYWSINITGSIRAIYKIIGTIAVLSEIGTHSDLYDK